MMIIPKVSKKAVTLFTVCFAFLLTFVCAAGFAAKAPEEKAISPEDVPEGVYQRFASGEEITYLVVMHKRVCWPAIPLNGHT